MTRRYSLPELAEVLILAANPGELAERIKTLATAEASYDAKLQLLKAGQARLAELETHHDERERALNSREADYQTKLAELKDLTATLTQREQEVTTARQKLDAKARELDVREQELTKQTQAFRDAARGALA